MGQSASRPAKAPVFRSPSPIDAFDASGEVPIRFSANDFAQNLNALATELEAKRFYSEHEWNQFNDHQRFIVISTALEFRDGNKHASSASNASSKVRTSKPRLTAPSHGLQDSPEPASNSQYTTAEKAKWYQALHKARYDREAKYEWGRQLYAGKLHLVNKNCAQCIRAGVLCLRDGDGVSCQQCAGNRHRDRCEHLAQFYVDYTSKKLGISTSEAWMRLRVMGGPRSTLVEIYANQGMNSGRNDDETRHGEPIYPPSCSASRRAPSLPHNPAADKGARSVTNRARREARQSPRQQVPQDRLAFSTRRQGSSEYIPSRSSSPISESDTNLSSQILPGTLEAVPLKFSVEDIPGELTSHEVEVKVRQFYPERDWDAFNDYQRTVLASKAVEFRDRNRHGLDTADLIFMDLPNPYSTINNDGLEEWPAALKGVQLTKEEEDEWRQVMWEALYDRLAQRQWGDRFYAGKLKMTKKCLKCATARIPCVRRPNMVVCTNCRVRPVGRCQHLERYYVDYASRKLNISLSDALARYSLLGGATRDVRGTTPEPGSDSDLDDIQDGPAEAPMCHASRQVPNRARTPTALQEPTISHGPRPSGADDLNPSARSDNSTVEVVSQWLIPSLSANRGGGASSSDFRALSTSTGSHWKRKSEQLEETIKKANNRYSALRALAENLCLHVSDARFIIKTTVPSSTDEARSSAKNPTSAPFSALSEREERLKGAALAYRKGLKDLERAK